TQVFFPTFLDLPHDHYFTDSECSYYAVSKDSTDMCTVRPSRHWCLLAEIVAVQSWPLRPMYLVKDTTGQTFLAAFHYNDRTLFSEVWKKGLVGSTICVMYANFHQFVDGQVGVRLEEPESVKILPFGLEELITASELFRAPCSSPVTCAFCGGGASKRCSRCSTVFYCSQICQARDWKAKHKNECTVIQQMKKWSEFSWDQYDAYRGFTGNATNLQATSFMLIQSSLQTSAQITRALHQQAFPFHFLQRTSGSH
ncbi:uncharacterized protein C8R40DRAFT_1202258, partial [Lentinula edodes]|uniref:uncharacterized protein n=1 Tax=Lentinula edodes TaxID=5353 RepID=UPI001E8CAB59